MATFQLWAKGSREEANEGPTVLCIRFCSLSNTSRKQLGAPVQTWQQYSMHGRMVDLFIEIQKNLRRKKLYRTNQGFNFLGDSFGNRDKVRAPVQFRRESQPQHLKSWFFLKNTPIHFHINSTGSTRLVKRNQLSFSSTEVNKPLPATVHSVSQIRFKFRSQF